MDKKTFILENFFIKFITTEHPAIYQYIKGGHRSRNSAIMRVTNEIYGWCDPYWMGEDSFTLEYIRGLTRLYLTFMEYEYNNGKFKLQETYRNTYEYY